MNWQDKNVLVTGAGGFIGSHLTERLVALGATVRAFVRYNSLGSAGWLDDSAARQQVNVIAGDIRDADTVRKAVAGVDTIFHLAALIGIPYSYEAPLSYVRTNLDGTLNVLQAARECHVRRIVHTSTSEVYGTARKVPISESHPLQGQSPYSASKIAADKMAEAFQLSFGVPVVTVRPFNTFGPRQSARAVIPTIITQCLTRDIVRLGNLQPTRDLNYVTNTVDGFVAAAESPDVEGKTINIGSGKEISMGELAKLIVESVGRDVRIEEDRSRVRPTNSEVQRLLADTAIAAELLQWSPRVSLREGLELTISWIRQNIERYQPDAYAI